MLKSSPKKWGEDGLIECKFRENNVSKWIIAEKQGGNVGITTQRRKKTNQKIEY